MNCAKLNYPRFLISPAIFFNKFFQLLEMVRISYRAGN